MIERRIIIASNRLPVTVSHNKGELSIHESAGGLATGLGSLKGQFEMAWVGWPGLNVKNDEQKKEIAKKLSPDLHPIFLNTTEEKDFYAGFSNEIVWPLFHCFTESVKFESRCWSSYQKINQRFCDKIEKIARPGDIIWVQDYHLMLLPAMLKKVLPDSSIGFFLHIPFPSYDIFRAIPWRNQLIKGLLGADLIGFHTPEYLAHFTETVHTLLGYQEKAGEIISNDQASTVDVFPMGINYQKFNDALTDSEVVGNIKKLKKTYGKRKLILSVDRLDYTKGILNRLKAFESLLNKHPELEEKVSLIMVTVPSRECVGKYLSLKDQVDSLVGYINGKFGTLTWSPITYMYRSVSFEYLTALYNQCDIGLVTPLRDGMNLVAKEYVASQKDGKGVLILSEMAGASLELSEALEVNPNDETQVVNALYRALHMPIEEQKRRMHLMQQTVKQNCVSKWANKFITQLMEVKQKHTGQSLKVVFGQERRLIASAFKQSQNPLLLLDYDGTLAPFQTDPKKAVPSEKVMEILGELGTKAKVVIISGRDHLSLEEWFGKSGLHLIAEHGMWIKNDDRWIKNWEANTAWKKDIRKVLNEFVAQTPGAFVETKTSSLAFHYRQSNNSLVSQNLPKLSAALEKLCSQNHLEMLHGNKVLEIRVAGINKGLAVQSVLHPDHDFILAIGDDRTDEDTYSVLPAHAFSVKVGEGDTIARYRMQDIHQVQLLLGEMADTDFPLLTESSQDQLAS